MMTNTAYDPRLLELWAVVLEIRDDAVIVEVGGDICEIPSEMTVTSIGYLNGTPFNVENEHIHVIGDAQKVSNLNSAIHAANDLVLQIS